MGILTAINRRLSRWAMYIACVCLAGLLIVVVYGVVLRYAFNRPPPFVEQIALLLVISVAMFGASAVVRDAGHIGMDSLVGLLPKRVQFWCAAIVAVLSMVFALIVFFGSVEMAQSTRNSTIPILGISEAARYLPPVIAGLLILLFSIERLIALVTGKKVLASWH